ncbi:hypothetical protein [uncultured Bacteroides sp.]|uniref:fimbrial biogenesis chaperone n=1 Tax=uncultured Bacteroides sp. TaxID=162156 RepID=UPI002AABEA47|nr:hypothetical protein [uncultured Bacteroides sp.]
MIRIKRSILGLILFFSACSLFAQGNLLVTPVRVIFENGKMREDLNVSNIGRDTAVYMASFLHYTMLQDGSFRELAKTDTTIAFADDYLRIFPRRVTLAPNESQVIRVQFRKPADMKPGEYRSHLYFRAEKDVMPLGVKDPKIDSTKMAVRITPIFGISIPVIIRNGNLNMKIRLSDVSLSSVNDSVARLKVSINREGERSSYGNLKVTYVPDKGKSIEVGQANGIGVYTELKKRDFVMLLQLKNGLKLMSGKLVLRYVSPDEDGNKEYAKTEYKLQ